jgi:glycopeptide antibiotics resistance protein
VIIVLAFAIEIGQWYTGTGVMESTDIAYGITGFLVMFLIFAILRGLYHGIKAMTRRDNRKTKVYSRDELNIDDY